MGNPDQALQALRTIVQDFKVFCDNRGTVSEADTRANLIDRVLTEVCLWPREKVSREEHVKIGYMDYSLTVHGRRFLTVEAKKEGYSFTFPDSSHKTLKLSGALLTDKNVSDAITQVRGYCDEAGIRYAVATNGYAWIVFRAIREDMPWREGHARIFPSPTYIISNFTEFWNLLSYEAIESGALDAEFGSNRLRPRERHRVVDNLFNSDLPLRRNRLHSQIHSLIETVFENIADQDPVEILQSTGVQISSGQPGPVLKPKGDRAASAGDRGVGSSC